jgi:hypothetical protein
MSTETSPEAALARLREQISSEGGPLAAILAVAPESPMEARSSGSFGTLVARGARASRAQGEYAMLVESILEGYLLHYGEGRILKPADPDLRLLAGDYLYAFGLARLAHLGDLDAVDELADLISLCAQAHASHSSGGDGQTPRRLTGALWALAALAVGAGRWPEQREAKRRARREGKPAAKHLLEVATERAEQLGLALQLRRALIAFDATVGGEFSKT